MLISFLEISQIELNYTSSTQHIIWISIKILNILEKYKINY